jgi:putative SOS response-associated peptidase YedK
MCGRFTLTADGETVQQALNLDAVPPLQPRYNVAPSQPVAVVTNDQPKTLTHLNWGLVPFWAKDPTIGNRLINARSETAHEKPSFKAAMQYRRCLIPADGWYEWRTKPNTPMFIHRDQFDVFAFAGLWERWTSPDGSEVHTCTVLTTDATDNLKPLHHRMPVVLHPGDYNTWLHSDNLNARRALLRPFTPATFAYYEVSKVVNKPANDSPQNIVPFKNPSDNGPQQLNLF